MKELIIKGIELGLFRYTCGKGFVHNISDVDLLLHLLTKEKSINENVLTNMVNAMQYVIENKMQRFIHLNLHFTNPRKGNTHKLRKCNETFMRGGVVTPTNCNQTKEFEQPYSIARYNDSFNNESLPEWVHTYNGSPLVRA